MDALRDHIIREFSHPSVQESYRWMARTGLWDSEKKIIERHFSPNSSVLDIGCGAGRTTFPLIKLGYKVTGIDITPAMVESAKELAMEYELAADLRVGDATALQFPDNTFDNALFSFNGWNMIPGKANRQKALEEIRRILRPGGVYVFTSHIRSEKGDIPKRIFFHIKRQVSTGLGNKITALDPGDIFVKNASVETYEKGQYINMPLFKEVQEHLRKADFEIVQNAYRLEISSEREPAVMGNCMFFVCRKS